jgi:hypothetical protein
VGEKYFNEKGSFDVTGKTKFKDGYIKINNQTCFYVTNENGETRYFNSNGFIISKEGEISSKFIDDQNNGKKKIINGKEYTIHGTSYINDVLIEQGYVASDKGTIFYIKKGEKIEYYTRWGNPCNENGIITQ